jgi:hypothetical protein
MISGKTYDNSFHETPTSMEQNIHRTMVWMTVSAEEPRPNAK